MNDQHRRLATPIALAIAVLIAIAGCSGSAGAPSVATGEPGPTGGPSPVASAPATTPSQPTASAGSSSGSSSSAPAISLTQAWATARLLDVATGETFRIADHAGRVIIVEPMAIWCSNCRTQQRDVQAALAMLPADGVVYVVLDVDKNENGDSLAAYRSKNGFQGRYAVAGTDVARALAADFGDQFLNPPSTPMVVIGTDGTVTRTEFGHKSTDDVVALAKAHGA
jgi:thiol-disulfide isomerase/thioredoxin